MKLLGKADLLDRWIYTRQGVHKALTWQGVPLPYVLADRGRLIGWRLSDIEIFESRYPELVDPDAKARKCRDHSKKILEPKTWQQIGPEPYLGPRDLRDRWLAGYNRVYWSIRSDRFPDPSYTFNQGRARVWSLSCILRLEAKYGPDPIFSGVFDTHKYWVSDQYLEIEEPPIVLDYDYPSVEEGRRRAEQSIPYRSDFGWR